MNKGGIGVGSASILLVFAVLSLTIFSVITFQAALTDQSLTTVWEQAVTAYYQADAQAESIVSEILGRDDTPSFVQGVDIEVDGNIFAFSLPVSEQKELSVRIAVADGSYETLEWKMRDVGGWAAFDDGWDLWDGF